MPATRRDFLQRTAQLIALAAVTPSIAAPAQGAEACTTPESEALRVSLNYRNPAPDASKRCAGCAFFSASADKTGCGSCEMLSGDPVEADAWCESWSPRP